MRNKNKTPSFLWVILVATIFRVLCITKSSYWLDESIKAKIIESPLNQIWSLVQIHSMEPPLYYYPAKLWGYFVGYSDIALRCFSVFLGVLSVYFVYLFGKRYFSEKVGYTAGLMVAISSFFIYYSQETAHYSLFILLSILSMYYFFDVLKNDKSYVLYTLFSILMLYTHYYAVYMVIAQNILMALFRSDCFFKKWLSSQITALVCILPWYLTGFIYHLNNTYLMDAIGTYRSSSIINLFYSIGGLFFHYSYFKTIWWFSIIFVGLCVTIFGIIFLRSFLSHMDQYQYNIYLLIVSVIVVGISFTMGYISGSYDLRYLAGIAPLAYLFIANGIKESKFLKICVILLLLASTFNYYTWYEKEDWRKTAGLLRDISDESDIILFYGCGIQIPFERYYFGPSDLGGASYLTGIPKKYNWGNPVKCDRGYTNLTQSLDWVVDQYNSANFDNVENIWLVVSHVDLDKTNQLLQGRYSSKYMLPYINIYEVVK